MTTCFQIDPDIHKAQTLPGAFYTDISFFEQSKEAIWARSWLYAADTDQIPEPGYAYPFTLLPGVLDEPLLLIRSQSGKLLCLSNVCTHRGKIVVEDPGKYTQLSCRYHGRCFELDGRFKRMPGFQDTLDFPSELDHLSSIPCEEWNGLVFVSLNPAFGFQQAIHPIQERMGWLPMHQLSFDPDSSQDHFIDAHWALYCDNYLEGFHIPFVHPSLNKALEFEQYQYETFPLCNLQLGIAKASQPVFKLPETSPDAGKSVFAYYFWLFPNLMLNFYPWGLSMNVVLPLAHDRTCVRYRTYRLPDQTFKRSENRIDQTELEDQEVVLSVQQGLQSRYYQHGRFSPKMEPCVHHFHLLIDAFMSEKTGQISR